MLNSTIIMYINILAHRSVQRTDLPGCVITVNVTIVAACCLLKTATTIYRFFSPLPHLLHFSSEYVKHTYIMYIIRRNKLVLNTQAHIHTQMNTDLTFIQRTLLPSPNADNLKAYKVTPSY